MNSRELSTKLWSLLKPQGFKRRSSTFFRTSEETIVAVNVQRSQVAEQFYFNFSVFLRGLVEGDPLKLKYHTGHLVDRLPRLLPRYKDQIDRFFSRPTEPRSLQRDRLVPGYRELIPDLAFLGPDQLPVWDPMRDLEIIFTSQEFRALCEECLTEAGLKRLYARGVFPTSLVPKSVQALLSE